MSAPQISSCRKAFTLVELLVAMAIIGILVALLLPAVQTVRRTAWEATVAMDLAQLDMAVDKFKDDYGHYPTDFSEFVDENGNALGWFDPLPMGVFGGITVENRWRQILAKISPTHNEMAFDDPNETTKSRMQIWWENVGVNLAVFAAEPTPNKQSRLRGPQVALWFWMTQVFNDAQYPITGPRQDTVSPGYYLILNTAEQKKFFDFRAGDLEILQEVEYPDDGDASTSFQITRALQRRGDAPLVYFHHQTYLDSHVGPSGSSDLESTVINFEPNAAIGDPPNLAIACRVPGSSSAPGDPDEFLQDSTYQIIAAGADESFGDVEDRTVYENNDNLCNFSEGRLDAYVDNFESNN